MGYSQLESSPSYQLWLATNAWQRQTRKALEPYNLTHVQFVLLASVCVLTEREPEGPTQIAISRFAAVDVNVTSQVLRLLERRGLIERTRDMQDLRAQRISVTEAGAELLNQARPCVKAANCAFFSPLKGDEKTLAGFLRILNESATADEPVTA